MRTRLLYPHLLLSPFAAAVVFAGCADSGPSIGHVSRPPGGVADKSVVDSPLGPAVADELVFRLAAGPIDEVAGDLASAAGGEVIWRGPRSGAYLARFADPAAARAAHARFARDPAVAEVRPNLVVSGSGFATSPGPVRQWNLSAMSLNLAAGWGGGTGVRVAVLDTGVAYETDGEFEIAPDLAGVSFSDPYDFVNDDDHANDDNGHGTHVTGIIASSGLLLAVAPEVGVIPIKVLGADNLGTELGLAEGLLHAADSGADVINLSLSFAPAFFPSRFLQDAVDEASASGALMVAAAGNNNRNVVTYPAAFRDVIAVSASSLDAAFSPASRPQPWQRADHYLRRAAYANRGYLIDVTAPGGSIDLDIDGDDNPEAILAQTFVDDPTEFEYVNYAGTSQAAAHVSGLVAIMRAEHPELDLGQVRAVLGETAHGTAGPLEAALGRGLVSARDALTVAGTALATRERPRFSTSIHLALHTDAGGGRFARATVDVVDALGEPAAGVEVFGGFTGGVYGSVRGTTSAQGRVVLASHAVAELEVVAFQVEAVVAYLHKKAYVDRPGGLVRIDSCSLELMSEFAELVGSGFATSPSPISVALPSLSADEISSVMLLNFSWSGATPAMAVVADRAWFDTAYPEAPEVRVTGFTGGLTDTSLRFTAESFPIALDDVGDECVDLVVGTFGSGFATSPRVPVIPDPDGSCSTSSSCDAYLALLHQLWLNLEIPEDGGTMPTWSQATGISQAAFDQLVAAMSGYVLFASDPLGSPVAEYSSALEAAGIGAAPYGDNQPAHLGAGSTAWQ